MELGPLDYFKSYGFRVKEEIGLSNGEIRDIILKAHKIFRLLAEDYSSLLKFMDSLFQKYPELHEYQELLQNRNPEFAQVLQNDHKLDQLIEQWVEWGQKKEEYIENGKWILKPN